MADLRTKTMAVLRPDAQMRMDNAEANYAADQALQASASSELSKGWTSAGLSERVNQLMWDASTAYKAGDVQTAKALEDEGRRTAQVAASWSPEVKNWSDVHDLSSGAKWAMGALGNVRSSVMPALGGLVGAAGGGLLTRSAEGARWGAALGAGLTGYDQMTNETAGEAMLDPSIRANKTIDQIRDTARVSGAIQAPLEALVPATMGGALLGLGKGAGKQAIKAAVAKEVGREAAGEFGTEFAQDLVGQGAINTLKDRPVDELDYKRALDSAMAGAVAGGGMGLAGGAGHVVHAGLDKTVDTVKDPSNVIERAAAEAGKATAKIGNKLDDYVNGLNIDPEERGFMAEHHDGEKNLTGEELLAKRRTNADAFAARVLKEPVKYGQDEVDMANEYASGDRNPLNYKAARDKYKVGRQASQDANDEVSDIEGGKVRASKMRADTAEGMKAEANADHDILSDIWRKQGVDEGLLDETRGIDNEDNRRHAIAVMGWTKRGFKTPDGEVAVPESMIRNHGVENTVRLVKKASDLLVRQGEISTDEAKARLDEMVPKIEAVGKQWKVDEEVVFSNLTPIAEQKINDTLSGLKEKDKARERSKLVKHFASMANGEISKEDDGALQSWFGPNANTVLDHFYKEKKVDSNVASDSVDQELADAAEDERDPNITISSAKLEEAKPEYVRQSKANEYFDTRDEFHKGQLERVTKERSGDHHAVSQIGIVDREIEKAEEEAGRTFSPDERLAVKARLVEEHHGVKHPGELPAGAGPEQAKAHKATVSDYERRVNALAMRLNKRLKTVKVTREEMAKPEVNFTPDQVKAIHYKDTDLKGPNATIQRGTLLFDNGKDRPYVTTAPALLRLMYRIKDGSNESTEHDFGGNAASAHEQLKSAIGSLLSSHGFARVGYIRHAGTKPVWMRDVDRLPAEFVMGRGKGGRPMTVRDAEVQRATKQRENVTEDVPDEHRGAMKSRQVRPAELAYKLDEVWKKGAGLDGNTRRGIMGVTKAFWDYRKDGAIEDGVSPEDIIGRLHDLAKKHGIAITQGEMVEARREGSYKDDIVPSEKEAENEDSYSSRREDNPATLGENGRPIERDERGFLNSNNTLMVAGNMAGSESTVRGKADPKDGGTIRKKVDPKKTLQIEDTVKILRQGVPSAMNSLRWMIGNEDAKSVDLMLRHLSDLASATPSDALSVDKTLKTEANAERLIARAKEALVRARAIVDRGGVNDGTGLDAASNGSPKKVGQGNPQPVRENANGSVDKKQAGNAQGDRAVAGSVRRDEGVAGGAAAGDPRPGLKSSNTKAEGKALSMDSAEVQAAKDHILRTLGSKINLTFVKAFQDGRSGDHRLGLVDQENMIRLALNGDVIGTAYHESIHEFFDMITKHGSQNVKAVLERMGKNKRLLREVSRQLDGHPEAQAQLKDPEEAAAYIYQFWKLGKLKLGPESENLFTKVANWIKDMLGMISEEMKAEMNLAEAEKILRAFDVGMVKEDKLRAFMLGKLNAEADQHEAMMRKVGQTYAKLINKVGHLVMPAEQTVEATGNKRLIAELRKFHQKTGEGMSDQASYFEAVAAKRNQYLNKLETALHKADPKDVELAREHLVKGTEPTDPVVKSIFLTVRSILDDAYRYAVESNVSRWDDKTHEWVVLPKRKNYFPQVWSVETLIEKADEFQALLLKHHRAELEAIANESGDANTTAEMVAAEIHNRTINSHGQIEIGESESSLGISPMSAAVNRRSLDWLDKDAFDQFKEKDPVGIMSSYVSGMVKRAEYTKRFGRGGELLRINMDLAFAEELGGEKLVSEAEDLHDEKLKKHYKEKRAKPDMDVDPPRLRDSIVEAFGKMNQGKGKEFILESVKDAVGRLDKAAKVIMALEGTLGRDITNNMRTLNSWMMTYQNFRLLSTTLFSSFNDTVGLMINGGDMKDAWDGFVRGIREVKLRWGDDKSQDVDALRAEAWGATDAGSFMDSIGQTYGSMYMNGAARRMSDTLFKYNGMEAWNRAMRIQAAKVAERVILKMKTEGVDKHDKAAVARFEDLFGKTFKPENIKVDANGQLDIKDVKNVAAVNRWVNGAILRPNAAQRPHWASDPHYSMLWHMKQFTYTFQNVILDKVISQAKLGNYRPAMVMMAGYTPVIIAADAVKEMLIPGDEPSWMKTGLAGMLQHGVDKAGLLGIAQLGYDGFAKDYGMNLAGPALSQIGHIPMDDPAKTALGALPFGNLARRLAQ